MIYMLSSLITSKTKRDMLILLFSNPEKEFYLREISRKIGQQPYLTGEELKKLENGGLVIKRTSGHANYYTANKACPIYAEIRGIVIKEGLVEGALKEMLLPHAGKVRFAFIYGSFARGEERAASDIDLMVIGDMKFSEIAKAVSVAEKKLGREVSCSVFPLEEFWEKLKMGFLARVIAEKKMMVVGDEDEFERFVKRGKDTKSRPRPPAGKGVHRSG